MNMRNLLKPGDFVMPMPLGIHITLQYNLSGNIEKVYTGFDAERVDRTDDLIHIMLKSDVVPSKLHITKGTSWVKGLLYTGAFSEASGVLPQAAQSCLIDKFIESPDSFNFFAATVESTSTVFNGATAIRQVLAMAKFRILPGWLAPVGVSNETVESWISSQLYTFIPVVTDYVVFRGNTVTMHSAHLVQKKVVDVKNYIDLNSGYLKSKLVVEDTDTPVYVNYSETVSRSIRKGSIIIQDTEQNIIYCKHTKKEKPYDTAISCPYCGRRYFVPKEGNVVCPNEHCSSRMKPSIVQFINVLNLPFYEEIRIEDKIKKKEITCIPDLFLLPEYAEINLTVSITKLLRSLVPISLIPRDDVFASLAIACSQNERTFRYYIENPTQIAADLNISHPDLVKLVKWFSDGYNLSDITTLLNSPNINLTETERKFDGAPIFRNKTICITGSFVRGTLSEIAAILQSYSAKVVFQFSNTVDCVLVGGTMENIDGKILRDAKTMGKVIMSEDVFFNKYEIDNDINSNLV